MSTQFWQFQVSLTEEKEDSGRVGRLDEQFVSVQIDHF